MANSLAALIIAPPNSRHLARAVNCVVAHVDHIYICCSNPDEPPLDLAQLPNVSFVSDEFQHATQKDWLLLLEPDEWLEEDYAAELRVLVSQLPEHAYALLITEHTGEQSTYAYATRLWRTAQGRPHGDETDRLLLPIHRGTGPATFSFRAEELPGPAHTTELTHNTQTGDETLWVWVHDFYEIMEAAHELGFCPADHKPMPQTEVLRPWESLNHWWNANSPVCLNGRECAGLSHMLNKISAELPPGLRSLQSSTAAEVPKTVEGHARLRRVIREIQEFLTTGPVWASSVAHTPYSKLQNRGLGPAD